MAGLLGNARFVEVGITLFGIEEDELLDIARGNGTAAT
jgi:hypothetical protein